MKNILVIIMLLAASLCCSAQNINHRYRLIGSHTTDLFQYKLDQNVYLAPGARLYNPYPYQVTGIWWFNGTEVSFPGHSGITNFTNKDIVILVGYRGYVRPGNLILFQMASYPPITDFSYDH